MTPARSAAALGAAALGAGVVEGSVPASDAWVVEVLRRGFGLSAVSFWPSASAVRATWLSNTLANPAGGPVADPGGPFAAAPGSAWAPGAGIGARAAVPPPSPVPGVALAAVAASELFDAGVPGTTAVAGEEGIGADGPVMPLSAGS
jgi:hypothetical protein